MQFRDLAKQYQVLKPRIDGAMQSVASESHYIMGPQVKALESELAAYVGVKHCLSCANGTDALTLALKAWGIGPGDAVFVPDFTFFSSAEVVSLEGATPIFVDIDAKTFNADPQDVEKAILQVEAEGKLKPRVIIGVDLFGLPAPWPALREVADRHHLLLLEDGAQGFGGSIGGRRACSFGDISTTSFFPAKPLGCYGDGGAVFTDNDEWAALIESYRVHGKGSFKYDNVRIGLNSRLDTLQAAILQVKLDAFAKYELADVDAAAKRYTALFREEGIEAEGIVLPEVPAGFGSSWAQYTLILPDDVDRTALQNALKEQGIPTMVYYPTPMSFQTAFRSEQSRLAASEKSALRRENPVAKSLSGRVLSLPIHPYITEEEQKAVVKALKNELCK